MVAYLTEGSPKVESAVFPMALVLNEEIPELPGVPAGSRVSIEPLEFPSVVTSQAFQVEPGVLYGLLLRLLIEGKVEVIPGPVSASDLVAHLRRAVGVATVLSPADPPSPPAGTLARLK